MATPSLISGEGSLNWSLGATGSSGSVAASQPEAKLLQPSNAAALSGFGLEVINAVSTWASERIAAKHAEAMRKIQNERQVIRYDLKLFQANEQAQEVRAQLFNQRLASQIQSLKVAGTSQLVARNRSLSGNVLKKIETTREAEVIRQKRSEQIAANNLLAQQALTVGQIGIDVLGNKDIQVSKGPSPAILAGAVASSGLRIGSEIRSGS